LTAYSFRSGFQGGFLVAFYFMEAKVFYLKMNAVSNIKDIGKDLQEEIINWSINKFSSWAK